MLFFLLVFLVTKINATDFLENQINNKCSFEILKINKTEVICKDIGKSIKLCDSILFPKELTFFNVAGPKKTIILYPDIIYMNQNHKKNLNNELAKIYFSFKCINNNSPKITLYVAPNPKYDNDPELNLYTSILLVLFLGCFSVLALTY